MSSRPSRGGAGAPRSGLSESAAQAVRESAFVVQLNDWPGWTAAERLRQWPRVLQLAERVAQPPFQGLVLLGSFARGEADQLSDVDFTVFVTEGRFTDGWERRHTLHPEDAACWDYERLPDRDVAGHRWLTHDLVLFDGLIATTSGARVADPLHVLVGDESFRRQLVKREPLSEEEKEERKGEIALHEVEQLYGQLKLAFRAQRARQ
jgi:Nucleotidyltransferase domain